MSSTEKSPTPENWEERASSTDEEGATAEQTNNATAEQEKAPTNNRNTSHGSSFSENTSNSGSASSRKRNREGDDNSQRQPSDQEDEAPSKKLRQDLSKSNSASANKEAKSRAIEKPKAKSASGHLQRFGQCTNKDDMKAVSRKLFGSPSHQQTTPHSEEVEGVVEIRLKNTVLCEINNTIRAEAIKLIKSLQTLKSSTTTVVTSEKLRIDNQGKSGGKRYYNFQLQLNTPRGKGNSTTCAIVHVQIDKVDNIPIENIREAFLASLTKRQEYWVSWKPKTQIEVAS